MQGRTPRAETRGLDATRFQADWWAFAGGIAGVCAGLFLAYQNQGFMGRFATSVVVDLLAGMTLGGGCGGFLGAVVGEVVSPSAPAAEPGRGENPK